MNFDRFDYAPYEIVTIIRHWYEQAANRRGAAPIDSFSSFIHLWIAFNAWTACCDDEKSDCRLAENAARSKRLSRQFQLLMRTDIAFRHDLTQFIEWWPIFSASDARRKARSSEAIHDAVWNLGSLETRPEAATLLVSNKITHRPRLREPALPSHAESPNSVQTMQAIYQVRCNLFHGGKAPAIGADAQLVWLSYRILLTWLESINPFRDWRA